MKCQILFPGKNKKKIVQKSSAENFIQGATALTLKTLSHLQQTYILKYSHEFFFLLLLLLFISVSKARYFM